MKYFYFLLFILISPISKAAFLFKAPRDYIVYNQRFCKSSLYRVTAAVLKKSLYKKCLNAGLKSLENRRSKLHRQFSFYMVAGDPKSQSDGFKKLSKVTRDVLIYAVRERLGKELPAQNPNLMGSTPEGDQSMKEALATYCHKHGSFELKKALRGEGVNRKNVEGNSGLIRNYLKHNIDIYKVFPEFRLFLMRLDQEKKGRTPSGRKVVRAMKKRKRDFLKVVDKTVRLKLSLHRNASKKTEDFMLDRFSNIENMYNFYKDFAAAAKIIDPSFIDSRGDFVSPKDMKNLYFMMDLIRRVVVLGQKCRVKGR